MWMCLCTLDRCPRKSRKTQTAEKSIGTGEYSLILGCWVGWRTWAWWSGAIFCVEREDGLVEDELKVVLVGVCSQATHVHLVCSEAQS